MSQEPPREIIAIDPGSEKSAIVVLIDGSIVFKEIVENEQLVSMLRAFTNSMSHILLIEMIASYGMPVGAEVFKTCVWIGRFIQASDTKCYELVYRKDVKMHHCNSMKAKDSNIRQAIIDKYGEPGTKKSPGWLYGISKDLWSAIAIGTWFLESKINFSKFSKS